MSFVTEILGLTPSASKPPAKPDVMEMWWKLHAAVAAQLKSIEGLVKQDKALGEMIGKLNDQDKELAKIVEIHEAKWATMNLKVESTQWRLKDLEDKLIVLTARVDDCE